MPPRAQRLYPRMRERPPEFQINQAWPLIQNLVFFAAPYSGYEYDFIGGRFATRSTSAPWPKYDAQLRRHVMVFNRTDVVPVRFATSSRTQIRTSLTMCAYAHPTGTQDNYPGILQGSLGTNTTYLLWMENGSYYARVVINGGLRHTPISPIVYGVWSHVAATRPYESGVLYGYFNGKQTTSITASGLIDVEQAIMLTGDLNFYNRSRFNGFIVDPMVFNTALTGAHIDQLADPSNVDLRIGNIPLILPPRRRLWPVAPVAEAVFLKRRNLGLRAGTREIWTK